MDHATITSAELSAIPATHPEWLFSAPNEAQTEYRALAKRFHPDHNGNASIFAHLSALYTAAQEKIAADTWHTPGILEARGTDGILRRIRYTKKADFGLGRTYIGQSVIAYEVRQECADLADMAAKRISTLRFPNAAIRDGMLKRLPAFKARFATKDASVLVLDKPIDIIRLQDVLDHLGARVDPCHVAWIISELLNLASYLEWAGLTHNDISPDTIFICPAMHSACLLGGWWYAAASGERMARLQTGRTVAYMPRSVARSKIATFATDLELIRLTGRELLGDAVGAKLDAPDALKTWLRTASSGSAKRDYREWQDVLTASFGVRRFVKLDIDPSAIYTKGA